MKFDDSALHFFLGANTPQGFVSRFDQLADENEGWRLYIIKGGPGSGKSTMLKKIAARLTEAGETVELIHCSSDPDSLDGVICTGLKLSFADGTLPHSLEAKYPGAVESLIDITSCWDREKLYGQRETVVSLVNASGRCHEQSCRFLAAAAALEGDTYRLALDCLDTRKLSGYCARLSEREFKPAKDKSGQGREKIRMLSAVTSRGVVAFTDSVKAVCKRIYVINDDYGAVSRTTLKNVRLAALSAGYDIITSYCPLSPFEKPEHILIPALGVGFVTSNNYHDFCAEIDPYRIINARRFTDNEKFKAVKKRVSFNRKAAAQMVGRAESLIRDAKTRHDELECIYTAATDFARVDSLTEKTLRDAGL